MDRIIFVSGGQRSGKSEFAEKMALSLSASPVYIATAQVLDEGMRHRVKAHQQRRGPQWTTIEAPVDVASVCPAPSATVLLDCVTLWATNCFFRFDEDVDKALLFMKDQIRLLTASGADIIFVSNEIGLGGVAQNEMQRRFTDLQGMINRHIASISSEAYLIVAGLPLKLK